MNNLTRVDYKKLIKTYDNFPKDGIKFLDISPAINSNFNDIINDMRMVIIRSMGGSIMKSDNIKIISIDSRGFIFGSALAYSVGGGVILMRSEGKLPGTCHKSRAVAEYSDKIYEIKSDSLNATDNVYIVDDVLATGNTINSAIELVELSGAKIKGIITFIEIESLNGRNNIKTNYPITSLVRY